LLAAGGGTVPSELQPNAPINLASTGALTGPRELDISGIEDDGRIFLLSVRNADIAVNDLTITATTDINGGGASLVVSSTLDLFFTHETGGNWRAYRFTLPGTTTGAAIYREILDSSLWAAGTNNEIVIIQSGAPGAGEAGPHGLVVAESYLVQTYRDDNGRQVSLGVTVDSGTGDVTLRRAGLAPNVDIRLVMGGD